MRKRMLRITSNFEQNLDEIRDFLERQGAPPAVFGGLIDYLFDTVLPNLEHFPELGVDFLSHPVTSLEARERIGKLRERLGGERQLREYIARDYLILYALDRENLDLLAIEHHGQLSFDLKGHWPA